MCRLSYCLFIVIVFSGIESYAVNFSTELNGFYFSDSFATSSTSTGSFTAADAALNIALNKKGTFTVGWAYVMISSATTNGGSSTAFAAGDMGPRFGLFINKKRTWGLGVSYNLIASSTYDSGAGSSVIWRGSSIKADFGWAPEISETMFAGVRMNYYSASWTEQLVGSSNYSTISYTRAWIYPTFYLRWEM